MALFLITLNTEIEIVAYGAMVTRFDVTLATVAGVHELILPLIVEFV